MSCRVEYDAYRVDLEELNLRPRDASSLPKLERAQREFQDQKERYQKIRRDLSIKVQLLEQNKVRPEQADPEPGPGRWLSRNLACPQVKVLHQQLWLLHGAVAAHSLSCHSFLDQSLQQAMTQLRNHGLGPASFLEES